MSLVFGVFLEWSNAAKTIYPLKEIKPLKGNTAQASNAVYYFASISVAWGVL